VRGPHCKSRAWLAAGYGWRILVSRPFAEENERMALAVMVTYLEMNGPQVEVWRGGRDSHGAASCRERDAERRVGSVGGEERGEEGVGETFTSQPPAYLSHGR
jgi:hypothetical protein